MEVRVGQIWEYYYDPESAPAMNSEYYRVVEVNKDTDATKLIRVIPSASGDYWLKFRMSDPPLRYPAGMILGASVSYSHDGGGWKLEAPVDEDYNECPKCSQSVLELADYLCEECRYG